MIPNVKVYNCDFREMLNSTSRRIKDYLNARAPVVNDFYIYDNAMRFSEGEHHEKNRTR